MTTHPESPSPHGSGGLRLPLRLPDAGEIFAGYRIERELARGGAGAVFVAEGQDGVRYALKVLLGDMQEGVRAERFRREVEIGMGLKHSGIVRVLAHGEDGGRAYLVMELLEGATPLDRYVDLQAVSHRDRVRLVMEAALAVSTAHKAGIVHRDLKPDNILVTPAGEVKVVDFGIARQLDEERLTQSGAVMGTLHFMSPEQVKGDSAHVDARADVYSLGATLFRLLAGRLPFDDETNVGVMHGILNEPPPDLRALVDDLPSGVSEVVRVAMAKDPEHRYANAGELAQDLVAITSGSDTNASARLGLQPRRSRTPWVLAPLLVCALLATGLAWGLRGASALSPEGARREAGPLNAEAWDLLTKSEALLAADADKVRSLSVRFAVLADRAKDEKTRDALTRTRRRLRALRGLLALAQGDRAAAASFAALDSALTPTEGALRGALAATDDAGDPKLAAKLLSRALARGIRRADLHGWRVRAWDRVGFSRAQAKDALAGLEVLSRARASGLTPGEEALRIRALLAADRVDDAAAALAALKGADLDLRWSVALARVALLIPTAPVEAQALLGELPEQGDPDPKRRNLGAATLAQIRAMLRDLGNTPTREAQETRLVAWIRLRRRLEPDAPLPPDILEDLIDEALALKVEVGLPRLGLTLSEQHPSNAKIQILVARMGLRNRQNGHVWVDFLPVQRRAVKVARSLEERAVMRSLLIATLHDAVRFELGGERSALSAEALTLCEMALEVYENDPDRVEILWRRADILIWSGDFAGAIRDVNDALEINSSLPRLHDLKTQALRSLGRSAQAMDSAVELGKIAGRTGWDGIARRVLWDLVGAGGDPGRASEGLEALLRSRKGDPGWWVRCAAWQLRAGREQAALRSLREAKAQWAGDARIQPLTPRLDRLIEAVSTGSSQAKLYAPALVRELEAMRGGGWDP